MIVSRVSASLGRARTDILKSERAELEESRLSLAQSCPIEFKLLAMKCCDLEPVNRPSAAEIVKDLEHIVRKYRWQGERKHLSF